MMVDFVMETAKKSCNYSEYGPFEHLLFLFIHMSNICISVSDFTILTHTLGLLHSEKGIQFSYMQSSHLTNTVVCMCLMPNALQGIVGINIQVFVVSGYCGSKHTSFSWLQMIMGRQCSLPPHNSNNNSISSSSSSSSILSTVLSSLWWRRKAKWTWPKCSANWDWANTQTSFSSRRSVNLESPSFLGRRGWGGVEPSQ